MEKSGTRRRLVGPSEPRLDTGRSLKLEPPSGKFAIGYVQAHGTGLGPAAGCQQSRQNPGKLLPADVARIGMRQDYPPWDNSLNIS